MARTGREPQEACQWPPQRRHSVEIHTECYFLEMHCMHIVMPVHCLLLQGAQFGEQTVRFDAADETSPTG